MKLPNADDAVVERAKVTDYLLDSMHPDNGGKAEFFEQVGFRRIEWQILADAFLTLARTAEVSRMTISPHGQKYVVTGRIQTPIGRPVFVQTIWIVDNGEKTARLVTAYPFTD